MWIFLASEVLFFAALFLVYTAYRIANPEAFASFVVPAPLVARAVGMFPTFEAYMDAALHHPAWGYYALSVSIGRAVIAPSVCVI